MKVNTFLFIEVLSSLSKERRMTNTIKIVVLLILPVSRAASMELTKNVTCPEIVQGHLTDRQCKGICEKWSNTFTCLTGSQVGEAGIAIGENNDIDVFHQITSEDACKTKCLEAEANHSLVLKSFDFVNEQQWCGCSSKALADVPEYIVTYKNHAICLRDCQKGIEEILDELTKEELKERYLELKKKCEGCKGDFKDINNGCYKFVTSKSKWAPAQAACTKLDANLLVLETATEEKAIETYVDKHYPEVWNWRTALTRGGSPVHGRPWEAWTWNEPNGMKRTIIEGRDYSKTSESNVYPTVILQRLAADPRNWTWGGIWWGSLRPYICELNSQTETETASQDASGSGIAVMTSQLLTVCFLATMMVVCTD